MPVDIDWNMVSKLLEMQMIVPALGWLLYQQRNQGRRIDDILKRIDRMVDVLK